MMLDEIKSLCRERHISLNRLEKELGFSQGSIGKMGDSVPKADRLYKIANYFDVPMETFFADSADRQSERLVNAMVQMENVSKTELIKKLCKERGITVNALERELGLSVGSVLKMSKSKPNADKLYAIAKYFGIPMESFFTDDTDRCREHTRQEKDMYEIFERLLQQKGATAADVAKATNIPKSTLSSWKSGTSTPKADKLYAIANYFEVPMEVFFTGDMNEKQEQRAEACKTPIYEVAAGEGRINGTYTDDYVNTDDMTEGYQLCTICGDSMYPVLHDGDTVKVHLQTTVGKKDIAIVKVDGETATAKYIEVVDNGVWLRAENKEVFQDRFYSVQEVLSLPITIIGKVVELRREI